MGQATLPVYRRIEEDLRARIREGRLHAGTMLPSRKDLARDYGVALATVERAVAGLLADGTLRADTRRGTFVSGSGIARHSSVRALDETMAATPKPSASATAYPTFRTLGITGTFGPDGGSGWDRVVISAMEIALTGSVQTFRYFDRLRRSSEWVPLRTAMETLLRGGGTGSGASVDALVVISLHESRRDADTVADVLRDLRPSVPVVLVTAGDSRHAISQVFYDNRSAGMQAALHLLSAGYHSLTFVAPFAALWVEERIAGAQDGLSSRESDAALPPLRIIPSPTGERPGNAADHRARGFAAGRALFRDSGAFATGMGLLAANDAVALGILDASREYGKTPGRDFGLIGFDDDDEARMAGLTSLRPPLAAMGREAARLLLHAVSEEGTDHAGIHVRLRSHLVPRASTVSHVFSVPS